MKATGNAVIVIALDHKAVPIISLGAIIRNGKIIIPDNHTEIHQEDKLLLFGKADDLESVEDLFI